MDKGYKPPNYNSVSPYLVVEDAPRMIALLATIFSAEELRLFKMPDGSIMHAEVRLDDSVIMLSEASAEYPANQLLLHVYVPDVDATYQKALDAGCEGQQVPTVQEGDFDKRGMFADYNGNMWSVSTQQTTG